MRASPQLPLFPLEPTSDAGVWVERFSRYFDDPKRHSGFLELAESAVGACPGDPSILDARRHRGPSGSATRTGARVSQADFQTLQRDADRSPAASAGAVPGRKTCGGPGAVGAPRTDRVAGRASGFPGRNRTHALDGEADRRHHGTRSPVYRKNASRRRQRSKVKPGTRPSRPERPSSKFAPPAAPAASAKDRGTLDPALAARSTSTSPLRPRSTFRPCSKPLRRCPSGRADGGSCASVSPISASRKASTNCSAFRTSPASNHSGIRSRPCGRC